MKRPAFQFYPADWRKDPALSSCSLAARGLWIELLCIAHESEDYGHLSINGRPMTNAQLARMVGESPKAFDKLLQELEDAAVFSRKDDGVIYSRRMVKDEHIRNVRASAGKQGGNPNLLKQKVKQTGEQNPTPSSSSSSSDTTPVGVVSDAHGAKPADTRFAPEPDPRRKPMTADWQPASEFAFRLLAAGPPPTPEELDRFRSYWIGKGINTESNWIEKLVVDLKRYRSQPNANTQGNHKPRGFEVGDAIGEQWLAGEREREARGGPVSGFD